MPLIGEICLEKTIFQSSLTGVHIGIRDLTYHTDSAAAAENSGDPGKSEMSKPGNPLEILQNKLKC